MRDYFRKEVLDRTYEIFGVRQTDEEKMSESDITFLLDGLCQVSKNYSYIPEAEQKKIISACMLSDKTYRNINLRLVAGWLEQNGKKYFTEVAHKEIKPNEDYKPLEGEERDRAIDNYLKILAETTSALSDNSIKGSGSRIRENLDQQGIVRPPHKPLEEGQEIKSKHAVKSFWIDGFEIYAKDEQDAMRIFVENFGQPKDATLNKEGTQGNIEGATLPENNSNPTQQENGVQEETLKTGDN